MGWSVRPGQPGAIKHEDDWQILQCNFLKDLVVTSLQERAVDIDDRTQSGFALTGREGNRM